VFSTAREPGTLAQYPPRGGNLQVVYDSTGHVVSIETRAASYRTARGVGPGAPLSRASALPGFRQDSCDLGYWNATRQTGRLDVVTVFTPNGGLVDSTLITQLRFDTNCAQAGRGLEPQPNIAVDQSIGGIALGMAKRAVDKLLGPPLGFAGTVARYTVDGGRFLVTYDAGKHAAAIQAFSNYFFTPAGLGVGSPAAFVAVLPAFVRDPCGSGFWNGASQMPANRRVTAFTIHGGAVASVVVTDVRRFRLCATK
jgi:hypothetical protein